MYPFSKHASINRTTPMLSSCHRKEAASKQEELHAEERASCTSFHGSLVPDLGL